MKSPGIRNEPPHLERLALYGDEKNKIGRHAASLVQDGEVLFLDEGTTPLSIIPHLKQCDLTILTNSFPAASLLIEQLNLGRFEGRVFFLGGEISAKHARSTGSLTEEGLSRYYSNPSFYCHK